MYSANGCPSDEWPYQVDGISGGAVRSFDSVEAAKQAYAEAIGAGLVYRVEKIGERHILMKEDMPSIPGMQGNFEYTSSTSFSIRNSTRS